MSAVDLSAFVKPGQRVLLVGNPAVSSQSIVDTLQSLSALVGPSGAAVLEQLDRILQVQLAASSFDVVLAGVIPPILEFHDADVLAELARVLRPSGTLVFVEPVLAQPIARFQHKSLDGLPAALRLAGLVNVRVDSQRPATGDECQSFSHYWAKGDQDALSALRTSLVVACAVADKPAFEVGAASQLKLSFGSKKKTPTPTPAEDAAKPKVWTLTDDDVGDEFVNQDDLLTEEDLSRPVKSVPPKDCGVGKGGKPKACKNCSCGLAEELAANEADKPKKPVSGAASTFKSSCGSCYLGDAFRCASCPYLGMPAFKPGEQVKLSDRQLKPDV